MYLEKYKSSIKNKDLVDSITKTTNSLWINVEKCFDYKSHISGLLLGHVQSGKTAQMLGFISKMADEGFEIFILLTTDNVYLQQQTIERVKETLDDFNVIGESDDVNFFESKLSKPILLVLKKNSSILKKWRNNLTTSEYCLGRPLVIIDDEADAASLNTLVNKRNKSTINNHLTSMKELASSSFYLEVTATPQSILLQSTLSGWKPEFVNYFEPGYNYLGGDFFYSEPKSFCIKLTKEDELTEIKDDDQYISTGLQESLMSFLVVCGHKFEMNDDTCNFLIHPSVRIADHDIFAERLGEHLNLLLASFDEESYEYYLQNAWLDLQKSKPDITSFEDVKNNITLILEDAILKIIVLNSKSSYEINYKKGFNIVIGGNSLGRGITLPKLQTVYYCRKSKTPQADTFWQHSRMFGYDRIPGLMRIFIPPTLHKLFTELNNSNNIIINQVEKFGLSSIQLIYPNYIKPTRKSVIENQYLNIVPGGVNLFPSDPIQNYTKEIDDLLNIYTTESKFELVNYDYILTILKYVGSLDKYDWNTSKFKSCIIALSVKRPKTKCYLIIRRDRDISKGTGTLLSPNDRKIGDVLKDDLTLTLYRVKGDKTKGWDNKPFWIPNIKFPQDSCFYDILEE